MVIVEPELTEEILAEVRSRVLDRFGYADKKPPAQEIQNALDEALSSAARHARLRGIYLTLPVTRIKKDEIISEGGIIRSSMLARLARMCNGEKSILYMIATAGEEWSKESGKHDPLFRQLLFDAVGSELAELAADMTEARWIQEAKKRGLETTFRFSPGYCDWDLKEQRVIFEILDAENIGVTLSPHYVMVPTKTVSAIALLAEQVPLRAPCAFCARDCKWRRMPCQKDLVINPSAK